MFCQNCGQEVNPNAAVCLNCGCALNKPNNNVKDSSSIGWWFLGFFFPVIGFILWVVWMDSAPKKAKRCGIGAIVGVIASVVLTILAYVLMFFINIAIIGSLESGIYM